MSVLYIFRCALCIVLAIVLSSGGEHSQKSKETQSVVVVCFVMLVTGAAQYRKYVISFLNIAIRIKPARNKQILNCSLIKCSADYRILAYCLMNKIFFKCSNIGK